MKKQSYSISWLHCASKRAMKHAKALLLSLALVGAGYAVQSKALGQTTKDGIGLAFTVGLLAGFKKQNPDADPEALKDIELVELEIKKAYDDLKKDNITKEAFDAFIAEKAEILSKQVNLKHVMYGEKSVEEILRGYGEKLAELDKKGAAPSAPQSFFEQVKSALEEHKEQLEKAATQKNGGFKLAIKASNSTVTTGYGSSAPNVYLPVPTFMAGFHTTPEIPVTILDVVDLGSSDSPIVTWVNEQPIEGDAGWTGEDELKSQVAWKYNNETSTAKKVTAFIKVTTQALRNIPWLASRINTRLRELVMRKIQDGIINGDGLNDSPLGILAQVPGYITNSFDGAVEDPNTMDVIMAMAGQIDELERDVTNLSAIMNGVDIRKMKWVKDANGNYVMPPFATQQGTWVDGVRVVKNNKIPKGNILVGDMKKFTVLMVEDLMIDIGLDGNDFTYNRRTIIAEAELITMLSDNDKGSFVYASIPAVKQEIAIAPLP